MKHRLIAFFLVLLLLSGCTLAQKPQEAPQGILLYFRNQDMAYGQPGLIGAEQSELSLETSADVLAERYFRGPEGETLISPFPKNLSLLRFELEGGRMRLVLSDQFSLLSGADRSLAAACITLTFCQLRAVESIEITTQHGADPILLSPDSLFLTDDTQELAENDLTVYYGDAEGRFLIGSSVNTKLETVQEQAVYALSMLARQPENVSLKPTLPEDTQVLDLSVEDGLCIVDFTGDFYRSRPEEPLQERLTILSIVNTLTEFDSIDSVQILVEGESLAKYTKMDLRGTFVRDESVIGPVRSGLNEIDASLYVLLEGSNTLTELPTRIKSNANETEADSTINALLSFEAKNGCRSAIPVDTRVLSITVQNALCIVDLSDDFAKGLRTEQAEWNAVRAIASTMKSLDDIGTVVITIAGESAGLQYVDLSQIF